MSYHINTADGRRLENQSLEEINAAVAAGTLSPHGALYWTSGMAGWEPLTKLLGLPPSPVSGDVGAMGQLIPVKNARALAAYYCAIFGLVPCFTPILGPLSLIFGILGLKAVKKTPGLPGTAHAWVGIILGGLQTLAIVAWLIFLVVAIVVDVRSRSH